MLARSECQRADWPRHKLICKTLAGGTWETVTVLPTPFANGKGLFTSTINRLDSLSEVASAPTVEANGSAAPPNAHGSDPFLIKLQLAGYDGTSMMVYDRQRSFTVHIVRDTDPALFKRLADVVHAGYMGMKTYRWAKRVSDWELRICLDRDPKESETQW